MMIRCRGNSIFILNEFLSLQAVVFHRVVHFFCEIFQHFLQTIRNSSFVHFMTPKTINDFEVPSMWQDCRCKLTTFGITLVLLSVWCWLFHVQAEDHLDIGTSIFSVPYIPLPTASIFPVLTEKLREIITKWNSFP